MRKVLLMFLVLMVAACGEQESVKPVHAIDVTWQHPDADFHLHSPDGKLRSLADFRGKVAIVFFGYTHCPEVCPTTLADLAQVMRKLGPDAARVQVVFITLDPERDTPKKLGEFVPFFDPNFLGLSGDAAATAKAAKSFGVNYEKHAGKNGSYTLDHSDGTYLISKSGKTIWMSRYNQRADYLVEDIRRLLTAGSR